MSVNSKQQLLAKLAHKRYRDANVVNHVKTSLPIQARLIREQHGWTQAQIAKRATTTQTVISRLEDPNYGNLTLNSLFKLASAFDMALLVKIVPFSRLLEEFADVSPQALSVKTFPEEISKLEAWAAPETQMAACREVVEPPEKKEREVEGASAMAGRSQPTPPQQTWGKILLCPGVHQFEPQRAMIQPQSPVSAVSCTVSMSEGMLGQRRASFQPASAAHMVFNNENEVKAPENGVLNAVDAWLLKEDE